MTIKKHPTCPACKGQGYYRVFGEKSIPSTCDLCKGRGWIYEAHPEQPETD